MPALVASELDRLYLDLYMDLQPDTKMPPVEVEARSYEYFMIKDYNLHSYWLSHQYKSHRPIYLHPQVLGGHDEHTK